MFPLNGYGEDQSLQFAVCEMSLTAAIFRVLLPGTVWGRLIVKVAALFNVTWQLLLSKGESIPQPLE